MMADNEHDTRFSISFISQIFHKQQTHGAHYRISQIFHKQQTHDKGFVVGKLTTNTLGIF
jgi:hypothetical protein